MLVGTEVKSLRAGHCSLDGAWARIEGNEVWLVGCDIPEYVYGNRLNHKPKRDRKLLLHKREIAKFADYTAQRGLTIVPVSVYFKDGRAKVEIAVGRGKQLHDKRESIKEREADRAIRQSGRRTAR
jgi:SsrA-binding protein